MIKPKPSKLFSEEEENKNLNEDRSLNIGEEEDQYLNENLSLNTGRKEEEEPVLYSAWDLAQQKREYEEDMAGLQAALDMQSYDIGNLEKEILDLKSQLSHQNASPLENSEAGGVGASAPIPPASEDKGPSNSKVGGAAPPPPEEGKVPFTKEEKARVSISEIAAEAISDNSGTILIKKTDLDAVTVKKIIEKLADTYGVPYKAAFIGICLLFLKGAANQNTPESLRIEINFGGQLHAFTKYDLNYCFHAVTGNFFIRRLAESLRDSISEFALAKGLGGDLAAQINNRRLSNDMDELTSKQKAYCSSFNQDSPTLTKDPELVLVAQELAKDFNFKFKKKMPYGLKKNVSFRLRKGLFLSGRPSFFFFLNPTIT